MRGAYLPCSSPEQVTVVLGTRGGRIPLNVALLSDVALPLDVASPGCVVAPRVARAPLGGVSDGVLNDMPT
jgi:hypothetical protein